MQLLWIAEPFVTELACWYIIRTITWKSGIAMLKVKTTVTDLGQTWEVNRSKWGLDPLQEYLCFIFHWYVGASFPDNVGLCFSTVLMTQKYIIHVQQWRPESHTVTLTWHIYINTRYITSPEVHPQNCVNYVKTRWLQQNLQVFLRVIVQSTWVWRIVTVKAQSSRPNIW